MPNLVSGKVGHLHLLKNDVIQRIFHEIEVELDLKIKTWRPIGFVDFHLEKEDKDIIVPIFLYLDKVVDSENEYIKRLTFGLSPRTKEAQDFLLMYHLKGCESYIIQNDNPASLVNGIDDDNPEGYHPLQEIRIEESFDDNSMKVRKTCHLYGIVYGNSMNKIHFITI
jgi:hypothetical protein